ncbi:hypothetical protein AB4K20DRAFT_1865619 [Rhizopus microsporus]|uniref:Secreted protein n=1 Tax=Rhizopus microsporus TaxID=58291 RepID=A0A1X0RYY3_RHIZD|nr:hypothetical protein BCV71DRAFT_236113 [Rhizopus microsporus]
MRKCFSNNRILSLSYIFLLSFEGNCVILKMPPNDQRAIMTSVKEQDRNEDLAFFCLRKMQTRSVKGRREYEFLSCSHLSFVYSYFFGKGSRTPSSEEIRCQCSNECSEHWMIQDNYKRRPPFVQEK